MIVFTRHALEKFHVLERHKFTVSLDDVTTTLQNPDLIDHSRFPLRIAQRSVDKHHVLRVVYKQEGDRMRVITFYPGRKKDYEKSTLKKS